MFFSSKTKTTFTLEWHYDDEMLNNVKIVEEYDKKFSLKHLMLKIGYSNLEVNNYMKYSNPFMQVRTDLNAREHLDSNYVNIYEHTINKILNLMKLLLIEDNECKHLHVVLPNLITAMATYIYSFILPKNSAITDMERYRYILLSLNEDHAFFQSDIYMCLNILIKRYGSTEKFDEEYEKNKTIGSFSSYYKSLQKCLGEDVLDGIIFKSVEYSLKNWKKHHSNKLFFKKDIENFDDYEVHGIAFKNNMNCHKLFQTNFELFLKDLKKVQVLIDKAYEIYDNDTFNLLVPEIQLENPDNYGAKLQLLTSGGKKKKYPLLLNFHYAIGKISYDFIYSYNLKGVLDRIDIDIICGNQERVLICKYGKDDLEVEEIKERNIDREAFPRVYYKK